jgi:hypothetical protein
MTPAAAPRLSPEKAAPGSLVLDFYGVRAVVRSPQAEAVEEFRRDFSWFHDAGRGSGSPSAGHDVDLTLRLEGPPATGTARFAGKTGARDEGDVRWVLHPEGALVRHDFTRERGEVWCADADRLHELGYILLLSRVGAKLDERGLHRAHGLGLARHGRGALALLPMGGGKTTLALGALKEGTSELLSEDTPLVDRRGNLWPFPVRFGLRAQAPVPGVPARLQRTFRRREWGVKVLIDLEHAEGRLAPRAPVAPEVLLVGGAFEPGRALDVSRLARWRALPALVLNLVVGVGVPQGREYLLRPRAAAVGHLLLAAFSRSAAALALLRRCRVHRARFSADVPACVRAVESLL